MINVWSGVDIKKLVRLEMRKRDIELEILRDKIEKLEKFIKNNLLLLKDVDKLREL